jgi:sulfonate transport system permease protein
LSKASHILNAMAPLAGAALLVGIWQMAYQTEAISRLVLSSPLQVVQALWSWLQTTFIADVGYTLLRLLFSLALGTVVGLLIGIVLAVVPMLRAVFVPIIDSLRSIPAIALFPLFVVALGIGEVARVASVSFSVAFLMALYTFQGIVTVRRILLLWPKTVVIEDSFGSRWWILKEVLFPGALPTILFGFHLSLPIALVVIVATEMFFGTPQGLGSRIISAQLAYRLPLAWAAILVTGILGYSLNTVFGYIERKYNFWVGK